MTCKNKFAKVHVIFTIKFMVKIILIFLGKCETSKEVARTIHSPEVSSRLETDKFIAIKLQSDSEYYTFFAQICKLNIII